MDGIVERVRELVFANRILAREGVVDAFGHISLRHPDNPERYFMSCSRAPELITADDIMEFTLDHALARQNSVGEHELAHPFHDFVHFSPPVLVGGIGRR